eukprot:4095364-Prymnesium_polylepis.2
MAGWSHGGVRGTEATFGALDGVVWCTSLRVSRARSHFFRFWAVSAPVCDSTVELDKVSGRL